MPLPLRVATYNLYLGADVTTVFTVTDAEDLAHRAKLVLEQVLATDFRSRASAIAGILVREQVDLVGLQEVARWSRAAPGQTEADAGQVWLDFLAELLAALESKGQEYDVHACSANFQGGAQVGDHAVMSVTGHNVILVRRGAGIRVLDEHTGDFTRSLVVTTPMPGLVLDVARSWGRVEAEVEGRRFRFVNTHLEAWDEEVRNAQRDELLATLEDPDWPVVLVGDFNATPDRVGMPPEYADAWVAAGSQEVATGSGPAASADRGATCGEDAALTGGSDRLGVRIDYVFVRGAHVSACRVVGDRVEDRTESGLWPSDHAGVVAEVAFSRS